MPALICPTGELDAGRGGAPTDGGTAVALEVALATTWSDVGPGWPHAASTTSLVPTARTAKTMS